MWEEYLPQRKRLYRQSIFLLLVCLISLFTGMLFDPTNVWYLIPVVAGFVGAQMAKSRIITLDRRVLKSFGSSAEEYY